jgi:hypothetical protein
MLRGRLRIAATRHDPVKTCLSALGLRASHREHRWRRWIAVYALVALAWPSLGPLPWLAAELLPHEHESPRAHGALNEYHHVDASAIPGSPTHPDDHDCFECRVLKHLSRCVPPTFDIAFVPAVPACHVAPLALLTGEHRPVVTLLPPVRAPPAVRA